jgi:hypothetical protein
MAVLVQKRKLWLLSLFLCVYLSAFVAIKEYDLEQPLLSLAITLPLPMHRVEHNLTAVKRQLPHTTP